MDGDGVSIFFSLLGPPRPIVDCVVFLFNDNHLGILSVLQWVLVLPRDSVVSLLFMSPAAFCIVALNVYVMISSSVNMCWCLLSCAMWAV